MSRSASKATMHELKLRRLLEHNHRLREELARPRVMVSAASLNLISYCRSTKDPMIPSVWGPVPKGEDPFAPVDQAVCCSVITSPSLVSMQNNVNRTVHRVRRSHSPKSWIETPPKSHSTFYITPFAPPSPPLPTMPLGDPALEYEEEDVFGEECDLDVDINAAVPLPQASAVAAHSTSLAPPPSSSSPARGSAGLFPPANNEKRKQGDEIRSRLAELRKKKMEAVVMESTGKGVPSLKSASMKVIKANASRIWDVGDMGYSMIRPLMDDVPMVQLAELEQNSPHLKEDTDWLWEVFLLQDFPLFHERCVLRNGERRTSGWRRMYRKAKKDQEERQSQAVSRMAERYRQLEREKAAKRIVVMDKLVPDKKRRKFGSGSGSGPSSAAAAGARAANAGSAAGSLAKAREQAKRARVALTHASGKYTLPAVPRPKPKPREDLSFKNPYLEPQPRSPQPARPTVTGPRLPPPRVRGAPPKTHQSVPRLAPNSAQSPIDLTTTTTLTQSKPFLASAVTTANAAPKSAIPGSYPTIEYAARRTLLPAHLHASPEKPRERFRVAEDHGKSRQQEFRRAQVENFVPPVTPGVVVDFFGDGPGAGAGAGAASPTKASGATRSSSTAVNPSSTLSASQLPMTPLAPPKRKVEQDPSSVLFRKKPKRTPK